MKTSLVASSAVVGVSVAVVTAVASASEVSRVSSLAGLRAAIATAPAAGRTIELAPGVYRQWSPITVRNKNNNR